MQHLLLFVFYCTPVLTDVTTAAGAAYIAAAAAAAVDDDDEDLYTPQ